MRAIDGDALKENLFIKFGNQLPDGLFRVIDNSPTILEVKRIEFDEPISPTKATMILKTLEEKPRGEWLFLGDNPNPEHKWSCNKCGRAVKEPENFCPNCGLKMLKGGAR